MPNIDGALMKESCLYAMRNLFCTPPMETCTNSNEKVEVLSLPETIKKKSMFRVKTLRQELIVGGRGKPRMFLYKLIQKHHVTK